MNNSVQHRYRKYCEEKYISVFPKMLHKYSLSTRRFHQKTDFNRLSRSHKSQNIFCSHFKIVSDFITTNDRFGITRIQPRVKLFSFLSKILKSTNFTSRKCEDSAVNLASAAAKSVKCLFMIQPEHAHALEPQPKGQKLFRRNFQ